MNSVTTLMTSHAWPGFIPSNSNNNIVNPNSTLEYNTLTMNPVAALIPQHRKSQYQHEGKLQISENELRADQTINFFLK
jgi:hypothetical protein